VAVVGWADERLSSSGVGWASRVGWARDDSGEGGAVVEHAAARVNGSVERADTSVRVERSSSALGLLNTGGKAVVQVVHVTLLEQDGQVEQDTTVVDVDLNEEENTVEEDQGAWVVGRGRNHRDAGRCAARGSSAGRVEEHGSAGGRNWSEWVAEVSAETASGACTRAWGTSDRCARSAGGGDRSEWVAEGSVE